LVFCKEKVEKISFYFYIILALYMSEKYLKKVENEMSLGERILSYIPGYRGYKQKEIRREADRIIRMMIVNKLKECKDNLRSSFKNPTIINKLNSEDLWLIESILNNLDRITQRIERAVAGYSGFFDAVKVKEDKLDLIMKHDYALIGMSENLKNKIQELISLEYFTNEWRNKLNEILQYIREFDDLIGKRNEILRGAFE